MSDKPDPKDEGVNTLDETQVEDIAGGGCTSRDIVEVTNGLTQAYENLVSFTSHVIERVMIK
jgi:hypothetical protein